MLASWGFNRDSIHVVPSGVSVAEIEAINPASDGENSADMLFVGRFIAAKGVESFVRTVGYLNRKTRRVHAVMIGDGPERGKMHHLAQELGVQEDIEFWGAVDSDEQVIQQMKGAKVFVYGAVPEGGWALSVLEANACGLPVVSVKSGALGENEVVVDGVNGLLVEDESPELLAEKVDLLLSDHALRARLAVGARRCAQEHDWDTVVASLEQVYTSLRTRA